MKVEINDHSYAWYLIAQKHKMEKAEKKVIALAQIYLAVQTIKQEINEKECSMLTEDEKEFYQRDLKKYKSRKTLKRKNLIITNIKVHTFVVMLCKIC